jgi:hypothetical protein
MQDNSSEERRSFSSLNDKFKDMPGYKIETLSVVYSEEESKVKNASELSQMTDKREHLLNGKFILLCLLFIILTLIIYQSLLQNECILRSRVVVNESRREHAQIERFANHPKPN